MDVTSPAENCQMDSISLKETTTGEKHTPLPNEPSKTMVRGSVAQNCPTTEGSIWEQNETGCNGLSSEPMDKSDVEEKCHKTGNSILKEGTLGGKPEHNTEFVSSEPRGKSDAEEKCHVTGNSISIESALGGKREHDTELVLGEPMEIENAGSNNADSSQMRGSCHDELWSERIQGEQMDTGIVGSDFVDVGLSSIPLMFEAQNFNELGHAENTVFSESKESTLGGKLDGDYELLLGEPIQTTNAGSSAHNSHMSGTNHNEHCSEHARGEPLKTRTVGSDSTDPGSLNTPLMCETHNSNGLGHTQTTVSSMSKESTLGGYLVKNENPERDSELVTGEPMETGSAGCSTYNSQTMGTLQNELGSVYVQGEPMETKMVKSDAIDVRLSNTPLINETQNSSGHGHIETTVSSRPRKRKSSLESSLATPRVLRPRVNGLCKPPEQSGSSANVSAEREKRRIKRKRTRELLDNEYSKTKKHLRYLLTRMGYEHNFIDAYSGEGWKGQSAEKIKPEKELQRATSEILRCKRRIRELFQHLDSLCAEGRFQESLFDSEGLISSEDIFCAKCASKDLSADNDIILCDGFCDRGFHQMCLEPPMLKEEIPPGDEGWLCPGCDCKIDCVDLLNDSQGTNLSIDDAWEKVFPEVAATEAGDLTNEISGLPSDDSEDYEYDPDASDMKEGVRTEGSSSDDSSSDDSDFTSASDDLEVRPIEDQYMGLPSDDSEDDEYDPNAPDLDETKAESSSSDFTSASEYFSASSDANGSSGAEEAVVPVSSNRRSKMARSKKQSVSSELLSILEPNSQGDPSPVVGKRRCERLDYKKLHDEAYGNVSTDSSDDEDWSEAEAHPKKSDDDVGKDSSISPKVNSQTIMCRRKTKASQRKDTEEIRNASKRRTRQNKDSKGATSTAIETCTDSSQPEFIKSTATPTVYNTLTKSTTKRLKESFKENEYPTRATRENLAKELGMTIEKVTKWFGSARWSLRHSSNNGKPKRVSQIKDQAAHKLSNDVDSNNVAAQETEKASAAQTSRNGNNCQIDVVHRSVNKISRNNKDKKTGEHVEPETEGLPNDVDSKSVQDQELGDAGTPKTLKNDVVQRNQQTLNEASSNEKDQSSSKLVVPETKILHADVHNYDVEDEDLSEAVTPKTMNGTDVNGNLDDQTLNEPSSERILVVSIPAISPKTQKVRGRGRKINQVASPSQIQTRSKKAAAPTD